MFNKTGLVKGGQIAQSGMGSDGQIAFSVSSGPTGYGIGLYPPGTSIPLNRFENNRMIPTEDISDKTKVRIIVGQTVIDDVKQVFYKTD